MPSTKLKRPAAIQIQPHISGPHYLQYATLSSANAKFLSGNERLDNTTLDTGSSSGRPIKRYKLVRTHIDAEMPQLAANGIAFAVVSALFVFDNVFSKATMRSLCLRYVVLSESLSNQNG